MKFDTPAGTNPIDQLKVIGRPTDRVEGKLKTTGTATYAYEQNAAAPDAVYGVIVGAGIAKGRIASMDLRAAHASSGVLAIVTADNAGTLGTGDFYIDRPLAGPTIDHYHQAIALVVAQTFEEARAAASLVKVKYQPAEGAFDLVAAKDLAVTPKRGAFGPPPESTLGDFAGAYAAAPVQLDETYTTPDQSHAMMEPHATIARWDGEQLTCWTHIQQINWGLRDLAKILCIPKENICMIAPYIGGSFGGKGTVLPDCVMAALGARAVRRPVKVAFARPQMFNISTHRPATIQRIRLAAGRDGRLVAIGHESWSGNLPGGRPESATTSTHSLYAAPNRMTHLRLAVLDLAEGNSMRAPGEATGMMALEIAMDEMAAKLGMDPVHFRLLNDTHVDPENSSRPFSVRQLAACLTSGAARFCWDRRQAKPASVRDGRWLIGMGMASAIRGSPVMKSAARVRLDLRGKITVETDMTDVGTGSYAIIAQTAAEMMGVSLDEVVVRLGDSRFPESPGSGGQWGAASSTAGVYAACCKLREAVAHRLGFDIDKAEFAGGMIRSGSRVTPIASAADNGELVAEDSMEFGQLSKAFAQQTFGAHFVEVAVDSATGEIRLRRMLAVCASGRILNPKAARSQVIGAMTMGAGAALMEEMVVDRKRGYFVNHDLAGYEVPVHADVPHLDAFFVDEIDPTISPLKGKGVGELGISGIAAAIANAVYNATGVRVRSYPITLDKLLGQLPPITASSREG